MRVVASFVVLVGMTSACGGAAETNLFDEVPSSATSSGGTSSGATSSGASTTSSGATSSSGVASSSSGCDPCESSSGVVPQDAGNDSAPPGPKVCNVNANNCAVGEYCQVEGCAVTGKCVARPSQTTSDLTPVCGCDHVTYWNASIAAIRGANVAATGQCGATGTSCTRNAGCAGDAVCNLEQAAICAVTEVKGNCWQLPKSCEGTNSRLVRRCNNQQCTSLCSAIADERQFVPGTGCL